VNATITGGTLKQQRLRDARLPKHLPNDETLEIGTQVRELLLRDHPELGGSLKRTSSEC
jgi:hypothetical protein